MKCGLGDRVGHPGRNALHEGSIHLPEQAKVFQRPAFALLPDFGALGVHHVVDVGVGLGLLNVIQVVADGHIEHKAVGVAHVKFFCHELAGPPGLHIFIVSLGHIELRRPLAVVAFVSGSDAGLAHALAQLFAVHLLDGLELKEAGTGGVGGHNVLGQLGVGTGGRAVGGFDFLIEDGQGLAGAVVHLFGNAEGAAVFFIFRQNPSHQLTEGNGTHNICHDNLSLSQSMKQLNIPGCSAHPRAALPAGASMR